MSDTGTLFWNQVIWSADGVDATDVLLLLALADHVDANDRCFPSIRTLATRARCSYSTAKRRLGVLADRGLIRRVARERDDGGNSTYDYWLSRVGFGLSGPGTPQVNMTPAPRSPGEPAPRSPGEPAEVPIEVPSVEHSRSTPLFGEPASVQKPDLVDEEFEAWWQIVPRKISKGNARKAFVKARKVVSADVLTRSMVAFAESVKDRERQFIPHPASWLNGERWEDEIESPDDGWDFGSGPRVG